MYINTFSFVFLNPQKHDCMWQFYQYVGKAMGINSRPIKHYCKIAEILGKCSFIIFPMQSLLNFIY